MFRFSKEHVTNIPNDVSIDYDETQLYEYLFLGFSLSIYQYFIFFTISMISFMNIFIVAGCSVFVFIVATESIFLAGVEYYYVEGEYIQHNIHF